MSSPGELIRQGRTALGLSTRELGALSGVSYPTISRIENGHEQPRWDTLTKIVAALDATLAISLTPRRGLRLCDLASRWSHHHNDDPQIDWTAWRAFADRLTLEPERVGAAISADPGRTGSPLVDNLLAAVAEKLADDAGIRRPIWTRRIPALREAWIAPGTPRMQASHAANTPPQFAARNLTLPGTAIWRERARERT